MADSIQNFGDFVQSLNSAKYEDVQSLAGAVVENQAAFEQMRKYLLDLYQGVDVQHTFLERGGQIVDCIPIEQQPSLRGTGKSIATPPQLPRFSSGEENAGPGKIVESPPPQLSPDYKDRYGNEMSCPAGTIPTIRLTLETLSRFRSLKDFFQKAPGGGRYPDQTGNQKLQPFSGVEHKWAHGAQAVSNVGGASQLNTRRPSIGPNQVFSLSQHWYAAGGGTGLQTLECGWQVYPQKYHTPEPCLFIYWTRDGYTSTGCYNRDCNAFTQTNSNVVLGGTLAVAPPGSNYEYGMAYFLNGGNWWFYLNGDPVGYYPASIFAGGPLSSAATSIDYGGETVGSGTWPPMGSGQLASVGFPNAAWQRRICYYTPGGGIVDANLRGFQASSACYTVAVFNSSGSDWGSYIFFGGPGGTAC